MISPREGWQAKLGGVFLEELYTVQFIMGSTIPGPYPYYGSTGVQDYVNDYIFDEKPILVGEDGANWYSGAQTAYIVKGKY